MRCLVLFLHDSDWFDFRNAEITALLGMNRQTGFENKVETNLLKNSNEHFLITELTTEDVELLSSRSITIRAIYELWAGPGNIFEVVKELETKLTEPEISKQLGQDVTWSLQIDSLFTTFSNEEKEYFRKKFSFLTPNLGRVNVTTPSLPLSLVVDCASLVTPQAPSHPSLSEIELQASHCFARRLTDNSSMRAALNKLDLRKRSYIGPTSLDHALVFLLANFAQVRKNYFALDPFVGTASILVGLSHLGCKCFGTDIDPRVLRGDMYAGKEDRSEDERKRDIFTNFRAYGLEPPELIRLDNHFVDRHYKVNKHADLALSECKQEGMFECIVTDPPYGIRAGAKKSGRRGGVAYTVTKREDHIPSTQNYPVEEVMLDLLHAAARLIVTGGRLVYMIPTTYDFEISDLPVHPCFEIIATCEQPLSSRHGRRAVVMVKTKSYTIENEKNYFEYCEKIMSMSSVNEDEENDVGKVPREGFGLLITKLKRALAANAYYDEAVVKKASNGCVKRKESIARKKEEKKMRSQKQLEVTASIEVTPEKEQVEVDNTVV